MARFEANGGMNQLSEDFKKLKAMAALLDVPMAELVWALIRSKGGPRRWQN